MVESQLTNAIENFIAIPAIILIIIYMIASAIDPILNINNQTFRILFTIVGGIPSLTVFFKKQLNQKTSRLKDKTDSQTCR